MLKNDIWIKEMAEKGMIAPLHKEELKKGIISYGISSYGYDMRIADEFKILKNIDNGIIDPKNYDMSNFVDFKGDVCIVPPNSFVLGRSEEYFKIPKEILVICLAKSTYARCGIIVNVTPLEPEWEGHVTIAISNTSPWSSKIYAHEGIAQLLFIEGSKVCEKSYADKAGKYQNQRGITLAKVK